MNMKAACYLTFHTCITLITQWSTYLLLSQIKKVNEAKKSSTKKKGGIGYGRGVGGAGLMQELTIFYYIYLA